MNDRDPELFESELHKLTPARPPADLMARLAAARPTPGQARSDRRANLHSPASTGKPRSFFFPVRRSQSAAPAVPQLSTLNPRLLWRRLLRWVVDGAPGQVEARVDHERIEPGEPVTVSALVRDPGFVEVNDASPRARVIAPSGKAEDLPLDLVLDHDGEYRARMVTTEAGLYEIRVDAMRGTESYGGDVIYVRAAPDDAESFDAAMRAPLLRRIAEETGGRFHTAATSGSLPEDITYLGKGVTVVEEKELWDMPAALALVVGLAACEWFLRRRRGLA